MGRRENFRRVRQRISCSPGGNIRKYERLRYAISPQTASEYFRVGACIGDYGAERLSHFDLIRFPEKNFLPFSRFSKPSFGEVISSKITYYFSSNQKSVITSPHPVLREWAKFSSVQFHFKVALPPLPPTTTSRLPYDCWKMSNWGVPSFCVMRSAFFRRLRLVFFECTSLTPSTSFRVSTFSPKWNFLTFPPPSRDFPNYFPTFTDWFSKNFP